MLNAIRSLVNGSSATNSASFNTSESVPRKSGANPEDITKTLIVVLLDESGSMGPKKNDVIGGYNEFVNHQKEISTDEARLTLIKFNTNCSVAHKPESLNNIPSLSNKNYSPGGSTALFDAIAEGVRIADKAKKFDERILCLIMTDGEENSSRETTGQQVKDIIAEREARGDWTFAYIGEEPERWANQVGMQVANAAVYDQSNPGDNFILASNAISHYRMGKTKKSTRFFSLKKAILM